VRSRGIAGDIQLVSSGEDRRSRIKESRRDGELFRGKRGGENFRWGERRRGGGIGGNCGDGEVPGIRPQAGDEGQQIWKKSRKNAAKSAYVKRDAHLEPGKRGGRKSYVLKEDYHDGRGSEKKTTGGYVGREGDHCETES